MKKLALLFVLAMFWLTATSQSVKIDSVGGIIPGSSVIANISLYNFAPDNICAFQFTINYDSSKLTFISISDWYSGFVGVAVYNYWNALTNSMVITVNWGCDSYGTVIPDGGILCKLNFTYKATASGCTPIEWADSPTPRLIANDQYFVYNSVEYVNGELCSCTPVAILTQPGNQSFCNTSGSADLSTTASGYSPITYQWQYYNGSTWTNVVDGIPTGADYSNETSPTMTVAGITTAGNFQYRCYLTNCSGTNNASTDPATITVIPNNTITLTAGGTQTKC
ncbi:MAG TPA: cohesin domain-containing protein, partial [Bacteroidales bacterium]|nr:cohesin domain-containing protein [Bacteroidales bacterium]